MEKQLRTEMALTWNHPDRNLYRFEEIADWSGAVITSGTIEAPNMFSARAAALRVCGLASTVSVRQIAQRRATQ